MSDRISTETIENISVLAKLSLTPEEKGKARFEMEKMLNYIDKLSELNTDGIEPMTHIHTGTNAFREDIVTNEDNSESLLALSPAHINNCYQVPKTIE